MQKEYNEKLFPNPIPSILHGVMVGVSSPWLKHVATSLDFVLGEVKPILWGKHGCNTPSL